MQGPRAARATAGAILRQPRATAGPSPEPRPHSCWRGCPGLSNQQGGGALQPGSRTRASWLGAASNRPATARTKPQGLCCLPRPPRSGAPSNATWFCRRGSQVAPRSQTSACTSATTSARALQQRAARALQQRAHSKRFSSSGEAPCSWSGVWRVPRVRAAQAAFALEPTSVSHAVVPLSFRFAVVRLSFRSAVVLFSVLAPLWCFCLVALM